MNTDIKIDMRKATELTRAGKLKEALSVLRSALGGSLDPTPPAGRNAPPAQPDFVRGLLERLGGAAGFAAGRAPGESPGGQFTEHNYVSAAGSRTYKLYVPRGYHGQKVPLIVMLHGCTQSPDDFAAGTGMNALAEEKTFLVAYPAQTQAANFQKCWNWFNEHDQHRDTGEPALIAGITRQICADYAVDSKRVFVAGLSAGGAAAAIMGATYPDLFAAIGVHSGLACGAAHSMAGAFAAMQRGGSAAPSAITIPTIVFHGDKDSTVNAVNGEQIIAQAEAGAAFSRNVAEGEQAGMFYTKTVFNGPTGKPTLEHWLLHGAGHAWSGGNKSGSFTDPRGPNASREMLRFFLAHPQRPAISGLDPAIHASGAN